MTEAKKSRTEKPEQTLIEVELPQGITAALQEDLLSIKGPKGEVSRRLELRKVRTTVHGNKLLISTNKSTQKDKMMANTVEAHVKAMVRGVQEPYKYTLKVCAGHFPITVAVKGDKLEVKNFLGEKVPRVLGIKKGAAVKVEGDKIMVESCSKELAGQVSSDIEQLVRRPGFDTRIFQDGIYLVDKAGKGIK
jgi:large subunit ribosomal protein L6